MKRSVSAMLGLSCGTFVALACSSATQSLSTSVQAGGAATYMSPAERARADSGRPPYTRADVDFMSGMIGHHAQAILMAGWAESHGAGRAVSALCARIVVAQRDEIALMQNWLRFRREDVPDGDVSHDMMPGMRHSKMMPGMLTAEQLIELEGARGTEFDRLFLIYMIKHHQGALTMVEQLFGSHGAGQDDTVFKFASDVQADQSTEIDRMNLMLAEMAAAKKNP